MGDTKKVKSRKIRNSISDKSALEINAVKENKVVKKVMDKNYSSDVKKIKPRKVRSIPAEEMDLGVKVDDKDVKVSVKQKSGSGKKKVKSKRIRMSFSKAEEQKMDKEMEREENISIMVIVGILAVCFIIGIALGYFLYELALNGGI